MFFEKVKSLGYYLGYDCTHLLPFVYPNGKSQGIQKIHGKLLIADISVYVYIRYRQLQKLSGILECVARQVKKPPTKKNL